MAEHAAGDKRGPGRPRSEATRRAILDAALGLLRDEPYPAISIDRIAATAKVGKQSIYRWWPSKADLILEAYMERATAALPAVAPSGDAFADLEAMLARLCQIVSDPGVQKTFRSFIAEAQFDAEFRRKFYDIFVSRRHDVLGLALRRGIEDGQIRGDASIDDVMDVVLGAVWFRLLSGTPRALDAAYAAIIVDTLRASLARSAEDARPPDRRPDAIIEA